MVYNSLGAALAEPSSDLSPVMMYARAWAALRATGSPGKGDSENIKKKLAFGEGGRNFREVILTAQGQREQCEKNQGLHASGTPIVEVVSLHWQSQAYIPHFNTLST